MMKILFPIFMLVTMFSVGVCTNATGVCGWHELVDGNLVGASFRMFDSNLTGWTIFILFLIFHLMLFLKTRNATITWVTSAMFLGVFATANTFMGTPVLKPLGVQILFALLVLELAAIIYVWLWK